MNTKKIAIMTSFIFIASIYANFVNAAAWTPLVRIPGLPATGTVNLSMYMVGLYDFLLSIVGIVAVMMLIIGGMRYITAAGNAAAIGDAKDIIQSAIAGLLLALLSWVFISTINPDILYIKDPGTTLSSLGAAGSFDITCTQSNDPCVCFDGTPVASPPATADNCAEYCRKDIPITSPGNNCKNLSTPANLCIAENSPSIPLNNKCECIDGETVTLSAAAPVGALCNDVCTNPIWVIPAKYHGINWDLRVGEDLNNLNGGDRFTAIQNKTVYFDVSRISDCLGRHTHVELDFDGGPFLSTVPERICCNNNKPAGGCAFLTRGDTCYVIPGIKDCDEQSSSIVIPFFGVLISTGTDIFPVNNNYAIWKNVYRAISPPNDPERVWVGISYQTAPGNCVDVEKVFEVDVVVP